MYTRHRVPTALGVHGYDECIRMYEQVVHGVGNREAQTGCAVLQHNCDMP